MEEIFFKLYENKESVLVILVFCVLLYIAGFVLENSYDKKNNNNTSNN